MATKPYLRGATQSLGNFVANHQEQLNEMLKEQQEAKIKEIKPEIELDNQECLGCGVPPLWDQQLSCYLQDEPHEEVRDRPKLWYLIAVLKKVGISLDQVGDNMGLTFLGNVIYQFKRHQQLSYYPGSCNYVCFLYNYFQKVSPIDWPAKNAILKKLTKILPKMEQTRNKAEKSFNKWWLVANSGVWGLPHCGISATESHGNFVANPLNKSCL